MSTRRITDRTGRDWRPETTPVDDQVVLLDTAGRPNGTASRLEVHSPTTPYHLAFSCYLFDSHGRVLLTRRALSKATWPGVWTNSCCGHPRPGETPQQAVRRRVSAELGATPTDLRLALPNFSYRAVDPSGIVEHEFCPVWTGRIDPVELAPDPAEVMDLAWISWEVLEGLAEALPQLISPWAAEQIPLLGEESAA